MRKVFLMMAFVAVNLSSMAQQSMEQRIQLLEDRVALKHLVDYFSVLADEKKGHEQEALFTPDATVTSISEMTGGVFKAQGREQIGNAFQNLLDRQEMVYHSNGQQTLDINGNEAKGVAYCTVTMVQKDANGERQKTHMLTRYDDVYVKVDGQWYIKDRTSHFVWQEVTPVK